MSLSVGIVGLPNVGKSTLFNALTKKGAEVANYPFCTIDPSIGVVTVPDERLYRLAEFSKTKKIIPAIVEFVDIAGLVKGASEGEGLGNKFLTNIRETDAIAQVVRIFDDTEVIHVSEGVDPLRDIETINMELMLADLASVGKRLDTIARDVKRGDAQAKKEDDLLRHIYATLAKGELAQKVMAAFSDDERKEIRSLNLLTAKPILYVLNKKAGGINLDETNDERHRRLIDWLTARGDCFVVVDAKIEDELNAFEGEEKELFKSELGVTVDGIDDLIRAAYDMLGLCTYFTTGEVETRAWTIKKNSTAPIAGMAIQIGRAHV